MKNRIIKTVFAATLLSLSVSAFIAPNAEACGGFFCSLQAPVDQAGERILFIKDGEHMITHVQVQYTGDSKSFSWVVPVPSKPELSVGSDAIFTALRSATRPQFRLNLTTEGECKNENVFADGFAIPMAAESSARQKSTVAVLSEAQVGPYDSAVIQSEDPTAIKAWLKDNGYDVPDNLDPLLAPYIKQNMPLLALKLQKDRGTGDLQPIVMKYKADKPMVPIQLTAVAAKDDMDVYVWVLGQERAIPENYLHAKINEARIDWMNGGNNYRQVVTDAINEAGGRAFVTDYAGKSNVVPEGTFDASRFQLESLKTMSDPIAFSQAINAQGFFANQPSPNQGRGRPAPTVNAQLNAFLARYIPKPKALTELSDAQFYGNLSNYEKEIRAEEVTVNATQAVNELQETIVKPLLDLKSQFQKNNYLTQLYTTISPNEMTVDPVFQFNGDMPEVSNQREATGVRKCSRDVTMFEAPIEITLKDGTNFTLLQNGAGTGSRSFQLPAAASIEKLSATGLGVSVTDNIEGIQKELASASAISVSGGNVNTVSSSQGFGCSCQPPNGSSPFQQSNGGSGEGTTYAFAALGFLGWQRLRKRK